jgi:hypothetical protein
MRADEKMWDSMRNDVMLMKTMPASQTGTPAADS